MGPAADRVLARGASELLSRRGRYVAGPPGSRSLHRRIRPLLVPGILSTAPQGSRTARFRVPVAKTTTPLGFSFAPDGWHPYVATLRHDRAEPRDSPLSEYYRRFRPRNVQEALLEHQRQPREPLRSWPVHGGLLSVWALTRPTVQRTLVTAREQGSTRPRQFIGPQPESHVHRDVLRLREVRDSIRQQGYRPEQLGARPISGYFLVTGDDYRFVCRHGNHRLAALAHLGVDEVEVVIADRIPPIVHGDELGWWTVDAGGLYTAELVDELFVKLFHETGAAKARQLGITA